MKKLLALILALFTILSCLGLVACDGDTQKEPEPDADVKEPDEPEEDDGDEPSIEDYQITLSDAPLEIPEDAKDICNDYTFTIDVPTPWGTDRFIREELNNNPVNDSIHNMNLAVKDTLGVTLDTRMEYATHNQSSAFIDDVISGNHSFDVMAMHSVSTCASLVIADAVLPFDHLEHCDLEKPWWHKGFTEASAFLGNNIFAVSSSCYAVYLNTNVILFNKDLAEDMGLPDLYDLVRRNEWTIDKLIDFTKNKSKDLNNDGLFTHEDQIAIISDDAPHLDAWLGAFRQSTVEKGENDEPNILVDSLRMSSIIEKVYNLFHTGRRGQIYPIHDREFGDDLFTKAFAEGRVLFNVCYVDTATKLRDYDINFGILPMPKFDTNQEKYGAFVDAWHLTYAVPADSPEPERTSIILETMAYYSYHYTYPAIIQQSVYGTGTRDIESVEMLELIYKNLYFDFGYIYNGYNKGYANVTADLIKQGNTDISSHIAMKRSVAESHFSDLYDAALSNYGN